MMVFFVEVSGEVPPCPHCTGTLTYRDSRKRIRKKEGGYRDQLMIRRFRCDTCKAYHTELPDCLVPYKHYDAETISGVIDEVITPDTLDEEDYPCINTLLWWLKWFRLNHQNIEGELHRAYRMLIETSFKESDSILNALRKNYPDWLEKVLRIIYNSGGRLPSYRTY